MATSQIHPTPIHFTAASSHFWSPWFVPDWHEAFTTSLVNYSCVYTTSWLCTIFQTQLAPHNYTTGIRAWFVFIEDTGGSRTSWSTSDSNSLRIPGHNHTTDLSTRLVTNYIAYIVIISTINVQNKPHDYIVCSVQNVIYVMYH